MTKSNSERQADFRARRKAKMASLEKTLSEIHRAIVCSDDPLNEIRKIIVEHYTPTPR